MQEELLSFNTYIADPRVWLFPLPLLHCLMCHLPLYVPLTPLCMPPIQTASLCATCPPMYAMHPDCPSMCATHPDCPSMHATHLHACTHTFTFTPMGFTGFKYISAVGMFAVCQPDVPCITPWNLCFPRCSHCIQ